MRQLTGAGRSASARTQIVGWLVLLVACALGVQVVIVGRLLANRADTRLAAALEREGEQLRSFAARGVDPSNGAPFTDVGSLLDAYLRNNLPETDETLFSIVDGRPASRTAQAPPARVDLVPSVVGQAAIATRPVSGRVKTSAGPVLYAVFPVRLEGRPQQGALVVAEFAAPAHKSAASTTRLAAAVGFGALAAAALVAWLVAGRVLAPIRLLRRNAQRIEESDLTARIPVTGDDEVAEMARTYNAMLDRLESAFAGQRRFLDDASHELRTPLTVVRGHVELMEGEPPEERERSRALVLGELDRMTRLVDDLLLLARAERPDFVTSGPVDLTELVVEVTAKAQAVARRRWTIDELAETTITADGQRLTQALLQLASNAARHTTEDDEIGLGSRVRGDRALIWVRDTGPGIDPADQARVFERSARGSGPDGERQGADGLGLGLAIVRSIAIAHGGSVRLESSLGAGARFTLVLPTGGAV